MLVITYDTDKCYEWHVNEKMPLPHSTWLMLDEQNVSRITQLQADGHELERIQKLFREPSESGVSYSILMPGDRVCRWYGDFARTIYLNLYDWKVEQAK